VSSPRIVGAILHEVRPEADKVFGLAMSRSRDMAIERAAARSSLLRPRLGCSIRHLSRSRIRDECIIDFVWGME
jgi:hypothetical protein